ncbi:MAG: DNA repair protein RecN [Syntrophomonadaceae bacterium]|nr:DNA repair protein RecN [Syntrophomonadaceae bacterium]
MLQEIYISNFVLIEELRMEFAAGLNILSGETGAGKSIIIDALGLLMGDRINSDFIRDKSRKALVEGVFDVSGNNDARIFLWEQGLIDEVDEDEGLIVSREINPNGKTGARINGRPVTAAALKSLSTFLVDMHLQNERQNILRPGNYLNYIDGFGGQAEELRQKLASLYRLLAAKQKQLQELKLNMQNRVQRLDFLNYQIKEIEDSRLCENEEGELKELRDRIKNAGRLLEGSQRVLQLLYNSDEAASACDQVSSAMDVAAELKKDSFFGELIEPLETVYYALQDLAQRIADFKAKLEFEPGELEEAENRLYLISKLKNKYGDTIKDILSYLEKAQIERKNLEENEEQQDKIEAELAQLNAEYMRLAAELSSQRALGARRLKEKVLQEMLDLHMPDINFEVSVENKEVPSINGMDKVDFLFSANPGEELKPVARIASGGEVSRFILALKTALAGVYSIPTLIFDEIDVGLGGTALNSVARKLAELSQSHQLILVTHSPQVASYGHKNFNIGKYVEGDKTFTRVRNLDAPAKESEIARMLDGEDYSELTLEHAREMIAGAQKMRRES